MKHLYPSFAGAALLASVAACVPGTADFPHISDHALHSMALCGGANHIRRGQEISTRLGDWLRSGQNPGKATSLYEGYAHCVGRALGGKFGASAGDTLKVEAICGAGLRRESDGRMQPAVEEAAGLNASERKALQTHYRSCMAVLARGP